MFEVQDLRYATLATVSRCGMVWFSEDVLSTEMVFENFLSRLRHIPIEEVEEEPNLKKRETDSSGKMEDLLSPTLQVFPFQLLKYFLIKSFKSQDTLGKVK